MLNHLFSIGIDHNTADLNLRGRFAMTKKFLSEFYVECLALGKLDGIIGLMTCNRNEFYLFCEKEYPDAFLQLLRGKLDLRDEDLRHIFVLEEKEAAERLFRVAGGFESVIAGEDQILGQVKSAMEEAIQLKSSCSVLNRLFNEAICCAKEIKASTGLSENKLSVASIGISLLEEQYKGNTVAAHGGKPFEGKEALVIGFGDMSKLAAAYLSEKGIKRIAVASRSQESVEGFQCEAELTWIPYDKRYEALSTVDMVISATGAPHIVFEKSVFEKAMAERKGSAIVLLDMAVPRDIDHRIRELENVTLFDMDDFKRISDENMETRKRLLQEQTYRLEEHLQEFRTWYGEQSFHHLFSRIDEYVETKVSDQAEALLYKLELDGETLASDEVMDYGKKLSERVLKNLVLKAKKMPKEKAVVYAKLLSELL